MSKPFKQLWQEALASKSRLEQSRVRRDSEEYAETYKEVVGQFVQCEAISRQIGFFSTNETQEDLATSDIQYFSVPFELAAVLERAPMDCRAESLEEAKRHYLEFLTQLDNYKLLPQAYRQRMAHSSGDAVQNRAFKLESYKFEQQLKQQIALVDKTSNPDDELVRKVQFAKLGIQVVQAVNAVSGIETELLMLEEMNRRGHENEKDKNTDPNNHSVRVETLTQDARFRPLLTPQGKVNRPFTIVPAAGRQQVKNSVYGTGQYLPTMSVEQYLEEELKRGGIISGGGPQSEQTHSSDEDEDDMDKADAETMKQRQWDEFTEANPKGSGNTMNLG